jgi:hypothetical protein
MIKTYAILVEKYQGKYLLWGLGLEGDVKMCIRKDGMD